MHVSHSPAIFPLVLLTRGSLGLHLKRRTKLLLASLVTVLVLPLATVPFIAPAVAAYGCPHCYGLERLTDRIYVEREMPAVERVALQDLVGRAAKRVGDFYGSFDRAPVLLVCGTSVCDRRTGGRGARAETYGSAFIRVSPRGINETILAHEFSHAELHGRIGTWRMLHGALPAWFDEGLAVVVSDDARYLAPGATAAMRCRAEPDVDAQIGSFAWGSIAGKTPGLYAQAGCRVLRWMEANGGRPGLLAAVDEIAKGTRNLP